MTQEEMKVALRSATGTLNEIMILTKCDPDPRCEVREANANLIEHCEMALDCMSDLCDAIIRVADVKHETRKVA